ncbi:hypothetical protein BC938DRAFT_481118 [Jimgerdemannia flammicorona]|uniref:Endothelin-converting enzyme 1 n=1 Tax=Jimgerdemannia flammicorona TaxID=994334 RepID=A0A433QGX9_9FUNG|nr:hypothetical protein BC938DRAFT_481118 [Jimgerdemannia flammicorona]
MSTDDSRPLLANRESEDEENEVGAHSEDHDDPEDDAPIEGSRYRPPAFFQPGKFTSLEKLMFFVTAVLLVLMCVFAGLYARSRYPPEYGGPGNGGGKNNTDPPRNDTETPCLAPECIVTASKILQDMDFSVNPCDDFYEYTCGGWINSHIIPDDKPNIGVFNSLDQENKRALRQILEGEWHTPKRPQNLTSNLPDRDEIIDQQNFAKLKDFYEACLNETLIDDLGVQPLLPILKEIVDRFPIREYDLTFSVAADSNGTTEDTIRPPTHAQPWSANLTHTLAALVNYGVNPLFGFYVDADAKNPELNALYLSQSGLGLPSKEYYLEEDVVEVYVSVVQDVLKLVFSNEENMVAVYGEAILEEQATVEGSASLWGGVGPDRTNFMAKRIVDFEKRLAKISKTNEELSDPEKTYNPLTISDLSTHSPNIIWQSYIDTLVLPQNDPPEIIISDAPDYIGYLSTSLLTTTNPRTLQEYLIWQAILNLVPELGEDYRKPLTLLKAKLTGVNPKVVPPRWETCLKKVDAALGQLAGRFYVLKKFGGNAKEQADGFIASIKEAFVERLPELKWVDDETRVKAIEKVDALTQKVGYATATPNILSPVSLAEYYERLTVIASDHFGNQLSAALWSVRDQWDKVGKRVNREQWLMNPQTVNAYYNPTANEIVFPAGILQAPFFGSTDPEYLNYGGIGVVVGHELTLYRFLSLPILLSRPIQHGFDNSGRQFDPHGRLTQWWTNATVKAFEAKAQCFVDQYSNFTVPNPRGGADIHVNGKLTLGENLADNGGLREAYAAWRKRFDNDNATKVEDRQYNNVLLPGLEGLGREQLFYVNYGRVWCNRMRPETAVERVRLLFIYFLQIDLSVGRVDENISIRTDPHSPNRWRVNGAVQNSRHFAETFECPLGSPMNPKKKCELW